MSYLIKDTTREEREKLWRTLWDISKQIATAA